MEEIPDATAFGEIVARHHEEITRFCRRHLGRDHADDAVQQTFLRAFDALQRRHAPKQFRPWLFAIALNVCRDTLRAREQPVQLDAPSRAVGEPVDVVYERAERLRRTVRVLRALPDRQRQALVLHDLDGRSYDEIAGLTGVTPAAVGQVLHRARRNLRAAAAWVAPGPALAKLWAAARALGGDGTTAVLARMPVGAGVARFSPSWQRRA